MKLTASVQDELLLKVIIEIYLRETMAYSKYSFWPIIIWHMHAFWKSIQPLLIMCAKLRFDLLQILYQREILLSLIRDKNSVNKKMIAKSSYSEASFLFEHKSVFTVRK